MNGPDSVTLPELVSSKLYDRTSPTESYVPVVVDLTIVRTGVCVAWAVSLSVGSVRVPPAGLPVAEALLTTVPASRSAWVTVCDAVHVALSPGARVVTSQVGSASTLSSLTVTSLIVTLPVLVTRYW